MLAVGGRGEEGTHIRAEWVVSRSVTSDSFVTPWTVARQAPLSMEFSRQEYWSGLLYLAQGIFLIQGSKVHLLWLLYYRQIPLLLSRGEVPQPVS